MPTRNELYDPEADAAHDRHAAKRKRLAELLHGPGPRRVTGRVQGIWRVMAEPVLIVAAALVGALIGAFYHLGHGDNPMLAVAGTMAGLATGFGLVRFVSRSYRARTKMLGGIVFRVAVMLLCVVAEVSGLACLCDEMMRPRQLPAITFE